MQTNLKSFAILLNVLLAGCASVGQPKSLQLSPEQVTLDASQIFSIYSNVNKQNYRIQVRLPASYANNKDKHYPVVIKVDGQWDFLLAASAYNCLYFDGQMPETIFVGIDWDAPADKVQALRARDLLPTPIAVFPDSGNAKAFTNAIVTEILPELKKRLRLNDQEFLLGGSWGGLFVTFALFERPDIFDGAIAIGGDYASGGDVVHQQIRSLVGSNALSGKRLYLGLGKWDPVAPVALDYVSELKHANVQGLQLQVDYLEGFGHSGMNVPGYASGYQYMFARPNVTLAAEKLQRLAGNYVSQDRNATKLIVSVQDQKLRITYSDRSEYLLAASEHSFYHPGVFFNLTFNENELLLETFYGQTHFRRFEERTKKAH